MMSTKIRIANICFVLVFLMVACLPQASSLPTVVDVENAVYILPTETRQPTAIPSMTPTGVATSLPAISTNTSVPTPTDALALIGTPLAENSAAIGIGNYAQLKRIGQWGRGSILGVGFTPDGKSFIAISELGWSIYHMDALDQPPQWVTFDAPMIFDDFYFSSDGMMVKFYRWTSNTRADTLLRSFPTGEEQSLENGATWVKPDAVVDFSTITLNSPDGTKTFKSRL